MTLEVHLNYEQLVRERLEDTEGWIDFPSGMKQYFLWNNDDTGGSIAILDFPKGSGVPVKHSHASNQFMLCIEGEYAYTASNIILTPGSFYMNPKDHPHGPTEALQRSILIEIYDGPHYYKQPSFHTDESYSKALPGDQDGTGSVE